MTWMLLLVLIALPLSVWISERPMHTDTSTVALLERPIAAFAMLREGDLRLASHAYVDGAFVPTVPSGVIMTVRPLTSGAVLRAEDIVSLDPATLPQDPVAMRLMTAATIPTDASPGSTVRMDFTQPRRATVTAVLLVVPRAHNDQSCVVLVSRADARTFGAVMTAGSVPTVLDIR